VLFRSTSLVPKVGIETYLTFDSVVNKYDSKYESEYSFPVSSIDQINTEVNKIELIKNVFDDSRCYGKKITFYQKID
jgi:hypothetical protein